MDVFQNPFHVLTVSNRDNRRQIMELADEHSLLMDPNECAQARLALTNPSKRLAAEVAWFPGLSPSNINKVMVWLGKPVRATPKRATLLA